MIRVYLGFLRPLGTTRRESQRKTAEFLLSSICGKTLSRDASGKPQVENGFVSISHSGDRVALVLAEHPIGIDIEQMRPRKSGFWARALREDEQKDEYAAWCKKEAYVKWQGSGFVVPPNRVSLADANAWFDTFILDGYQIALCSDQARAIELHREVAQDVWETTLLHR